MDILFHRSDWIKSTRLLAANYEKIVNSFADNVLDEVSCINIKNLI